MTRPRIVLLLLLWLAAAGCAGRPSVPPITTATDATPSYGKFVWYDLLTEDVAATKKFYGELLGWEFAPSEARNYTVIRHRGRDIGGIVDMSKINPDSNESQWISVLSVPDVDEAARVTRDAGGEIHVEPRDLPGRGRFAVVSDPQGAVVSLLRAVKGDPPERKADLGDWMWTELWTSDVDASVSFYGDLIGYILEDKTILGDIEYSVLQRDDVPRAGLIEKPVADVRAHWLPYVRVESPEDLAQRAEGLGGTVLLKPREGARKGSVAIVLDPSGAALALQKWDS
jgi:predicted enzyme related to lactoylglutathione lyase